MCLEVKKLSYTQVGLMEETETKMRAKPKPKANPGECKGEIWERGSVKPHKDFENLNLKLYNLAIVEAKINNYQ